MFSQDHSGIVRNFSTICLLMLAGLVPLSLAGCNSQAEKVGNTKNAAGHGDADHGHDEHGHDEHGHGHEGHNHAGGEALFWQREDLKLADCNLMLGQHGAHIHAGEDVEPAVVIERAGKPVADAQVFASLVTDDGTVVLAEEKPLVFETAHEHEPAHYAQGRLKVPTDAKSLTIRFRIKLPEAAEAETFDVPAPVDRD